MSLLAIDAGNTRIKWGLWDQHDNAWHGVDAANLAGNLDRLAQVATQADRAAGCDVTGVAKERIHKVLGSLPCVWITAQAQAHDVSNRYQRPEELGADRWCALLALRAMYGRGLVVVAGTAITIDALDDEGAFVGGLILPGRKLMHQALAHGTLLPEVGAREILGEPISTTAAIAAGSLFAAAGATSLFAKRWNLEHAPLVLAGGDAKLLAPLLPEGKVHEDLILRGIVISSA